MGYTSLIWPPKAPSFLADPTPTLERVLPPFDTGLLGSPVATKP
jgi:hypothetical protein